MLPYYDGILVAIPTALAGPLALSFASSLTVTTTLPVGSCLAGLLIGHAMFVRAP